MLELVGSKRVLGMSHKIAKLPFAEIGANISEGKIRGENEGAERYTKYARA